MERAERREERRFGGMGKYDFRTEAVFWGINPVDEMTMVSTLAFQGVGCF
jgi:hypothetical protein